jgi:hypothetical protein
MPVILVMRKAALEVATEEGGLIDWSSEDVDEWAREARDMRWFRWPSRSVSEPERTCSRSSRYCVLAWELLLDWEWECACW